MKHLKRKILEIATKSGEGHISTAFSILEILWVLYDRVLNISPETVSHPDRDRFVLSKGHASIGLYAVLAEKGFITEETLHSFGRFDSILGGHPDRTKVPGVETSTGSLGHGFPMAVGLALAMKIRKQKGRVYTIIGDGECNEGTVWESALLAPHQKLDNLCCIVDYNHSNDRSLVLGDVEAKFKSFGWHTIAIDGHDEEAIYKALTAKSERPIAVIAATIKGKGVKSMEHNPEWHHKSPKPEELEAFLKELI
ncbi:MAG TPA: transketolase [Candidatus Paceibacterota bacterium]|nr:transketolase [Candidatus Paceibacterota bacterium]